MSEFDKEAHRKKWEPKLWVMFDRARKDRPGDYLLSWAILMEIDKLNDLDTKLIKDIDIEST